MTTAILLLAGSGSRLHPLTIDRPKCLVELGGKPLLQWQLDALRAAGISRIVAVTGYQSHRLASWVGHGLDQVYHNPEFERTNMVASLFRAEEELGSDVLVAYGDIVYSPAVVEAILRSASDISVAIDLEWRELWTLRFEDPLSDAETLVLGPDDGILEIGNRTRDISAIMGQFIGLTKFTDRGTSQLRETYAKARQDLLVGDSVWGGVTDLARADMTQLLRGMIEDGHHVQAVPIRGDWVEIDSLSDFRLYERILAAAPGDPVYRAGRRVPETVVGPHALRALLRDCEGIRPSPDPRQPEGRVSHDVIVGLADRTLAQGGTDRELLDALSLKVSSSGELHDFYGPRWRAVPGSHHVPPPLLLLLAAVFLSFPGTGPLAVKYLNSAFFVLDAAARREAEAGLLLELTAVAQARLQAMTGN